MYSSRRPASARGAYASSRTWGGMRWTLWRRKTSGANADGEVVWSWRPDAGAKFLRSKLLRDDGGKRARSPGRARISRKTIAWGMPDVSGASAVNTRVHTPTTKRTRGCGCIGHPVFPAPSYFLWGQSFRKTRTHRAARIRWCVLFSSLKIESGMVRTLHPRRPGEDQDSYAVAPMLRHAVRRLSCND